MPYKDFKIATSLSSISSQTLHAQIFQRFMTNIANQNIQTCKVLALTNSQTVHAQIINRLVTRMLYHPVKTSGHFCTAPMSNQELVPAHQITRSIRARPPLFKPPICLAAFATLH